MEIAVIGISHKEAPVGIRGKVAFTSSLKEEASQYLTEKGLPELMIISTCNRSEIYIATTDMHKDIELVKHYFERMAGQSIGPYIFVKKYEVALQHIYQVTTGLSSLIIGEDQILGQVKDALNYSIEAGSSKKYLSKIVREAVTFSKKIRTAYKLSENQLSVASIGIKYLQDLYKDLSEKKILLVGTGAMGMLILKYLEVEGVKDIYLTNRTFNIEKMPDNVGPKVQMVKYTSRYEMLGVVDIVISATASPHTIFKKEHIGTIESPLTFLDMAVPRDIDDQIDKMPYANVVTLDDFEQIADGHMKKRLDVAKQINRLILEEVKELELWLLRSKVDNVIAHFHGKQSDVVEEALAQVRKSMSLDDNQEEVIETIIKRAALAMVKEPIKQLKSLEDDSDIDNYKMMIERLFRIEGGE